MTTIEELDEFVNWDNAADPGPVVDMTSIVNSDPNLDLALENAAADDFSFWALEHFSSSSAAPPSTGGATGDALSLNLTATATATATAAASMGWETPGAPCDHCQRGGYQCKKMREGKYKGYCTSCVALRCQCSFGFGHDLSTNSASPRGATFPPNPWPTLGDHPDPIGMNYDPGQNPLQVVEAGASSTSDLPTAKERMSAPKIGARFSKQSVKTLKNWLSTHSRHPYPTDEEKEALMRHTGLNKVQITNWLANTRRRNIFKAPRSTSPHVRSTLTGPSPGAIDIPRRRGTPSPLESMNPLQRWVDSPPDHEPASVTDIARAITTSSSTLSSGLSSPHRINTDDGSTKSLYNWSSVSSLGTSHSSTNSFASAYSHGSRGSLGSINSFTRGRRRRRRVTPKRGKEATVLHAPLKTYQCTFCTLTFKTKHDWQRHEKSLHLSLERWVCAPDGPQTPNPNTGQVSCVFCGEANPDEAHIDTHNHCSCQDRSLEERTFYRKDHLRQHLKLVHNVKFLSWSMEAWKVVNPEIRSRCGFCGIVMDNWTFRVDHLAEHFKTGYSMADWRGDWGFDAPVLHMVENSIPPFLIDGARNSPLPDTSGAPPTEPPKNAYELLRLELTSCMFKYTEDTGRTLSDEEIRHEACRIIFAAEVLSHGDEISSVSSWLRDLVIPGSSPHEFAEPEQPGKVIGGQGENRFSALKISGKNRMFDRCDFERELNEFCKVKNMLGLTAMDNELQEEACRIISRQEEMSSHPADAIANWFVRLIYSSTKWLAPFRRRASLPRSEDVGDASQRSKDPSTIDSTIYNYSRLETELADYVRQQRTLGIEPTDADLQRQGRIIIYEFDDAWNQTAADHEPWLAAFRGRHLDHSNLASASNLSALDSPFTFESTTQQSQRQPMQDPKGPPGPSTTPTHLPPKGSPWMPSTYDNPKMSMFLLNDANCYRRLELELAKWVKTIISANNPNRHIPTDAEIQHQARCILYDDDDPWNQTAADNAEWLRRFKRDAGLLSDSGPGLPATDSWAVQLGGSGFAPPYVNAKNYHHASAHENTVLVSMDGGVKTFAAPAESASAFLETLSTRFAPMPKVFCPRELESGLLEFAQGEMIKGRFPSDSDLRQQAQLILGTDETPANDPVLLQGFKEMVKNTLSDASLSDTTNSIMPGLGTNHRQPARPKDTLPPLAFGIASQVQARHHHEQDGQNGGGQIRVDMTEDELDDMIMGMDFELNSQEFDLAATTGLGFNQDFPQS